MQGDRQALRAGSILVVSVVPCLFSGKAGDFQRVLEGDRLIAVIVADTVADPLVLGVVGEAILHHAVVQKRTAAGIGGQADKAALPAVCAAQGEGDRNILGGQHRLPAIIIGRSRGVFQLKGQLFGSGGIAVFIVVEPFLEYVNREGVELVGNG